MRAAAALLAATLAAGASAQDSPPCASGTFWQPDELPAVHQLNMIMSQPLFDGLCQHQMDRSRVASGQLHFNDEAVYEGVEIKVHGGDYQRRGVTKPSFRLKWSSDDPFSGKHGNPFSYPKTGCNNMKKMTLRGEWNDYPMSNQGIMIRNKVSQDLIKKMGGQTPRVEWAVLSVNGEYFGFYSLEEHVSEAFFECQGWDVGASSLFKAANPTDGTRWHQTGSRALGGFESKMPDSHPRSAWSRDLDQLFTPMNDPHVTLPELSAVFNITDYLIWQMATTYSLNGDTGAHNMYLHGPTAGVEQSDPNRLWRVVK